MQNNDNARSNSVPIIGGVVGGFLGLIILVGLLWCLIRRQRRWNDTFELDDDIYSVQNMKGRHRRFDLDGEVDPKPYQYGLVGYTTSPPAGGSPPGSPPLLSTNIDDANFFSAPSHGRRPSSTVPLLLSPSISTSGPNIETAVSSTDGSATLLQPPTQHEFTRPNDLIRLSLPVIVASRNPMADLASVDSRGSPTSLREPRLTLRIVNTAFSPTMSSLAGSPVGAQEASSSPIGSCTSTKTNGGQRQNSKDVVVHTDERVDSDMTGTDAANQPPA